MNVAAVTLHSLTVSQKNYQNIRNFSDTGYDIFSNRSDHPENSSDWFLFWRKRELIEKAKSCNSTTCWEGVWAEKSKVDQK